jgi:hypothetical protein
MRAVGLRFQPGCSTGRPAPGCAWWPMPNNHRNGYSKKSVLTGTSKMTLSVPPDRAATFDPKLIAKYQRRFPDFDEKIISMYALISAQWSQMSPGPYFAKAPVKPPLLDYGGRCSTEEINGLPHGSLRAAASHRFTTSGATTGLLPRMIIVGAPGLAGATCEPFIPSPRRCRRAHNGSSPRGFRFLYSGAMRLRSGGRQRRPGSFARC